MDQSFLINNMFRPIAIGLSPNVQIDDIWEAIKIFIVPSMWKKGNAQNKLKDWFKAYYQSDNLYLFNSGRLALFSLLKSFNIGVGDEVIIQGFTCVAVPAAIIWAGAKPVYADIDNSLNLDVGLLEKTINKKTRAIIVQHTFGTPANIKMITKIAQEHNIILIEDCAHSLGAVKGNLRIGQFGDAAFFSFGRDKIISSVFGGAAFINQKNTEVKHRLQQINNNMPDMSYFWILKQLLHPLVFSLILPLYNLNIGKLVLFLLIKFQLISKPVEKKELQAGKPSFFPGKLPNALAVLALHQLSKLEKYNGKRKEIATRYLNELKGLNNILLPNTDNDSIYLRFNLRIIKNRDNFYKYFRKHKIILGNWYSNVIDPKGVDFEKIYYRKGILPKSEKIANESINLPTYPSLTNEDVNNIIALIKSYADTGN